ncbi:MAG: LysR family transcriptional regulator [Mogibacterium sp.]|nr:LysR family transcriptional regulator [Mogibacterium sp.]
MNTQRIKVLLASIDKGSLTKAGQIYGYTQSAVTQMMKAYEEEVGFPLLNKTNKGVEPTNEAEMLIPTMRKILNYEERLSQEIAGIKGIQRGTIKIGSFVSTSVNWIPQVLEYYQKNYPEVEFQIEECGHDEMLQGLNEGTLDIALMSDPEDKRIEFIPLVEDPLFVVFSPKYDLSKYDYVPVDILKDYPFIMTYRTYDRDPHLVFEKAGFMPDVKYYSREDTAVLSMVKSGLGIAILPELTIEEFPGKYDFRMLDPEAYRTLGIGVKSLREASPLTKSVISFIKENIK